MNKRIEKMVKNYEAGKLEAMMKYMILKTLNVMQQLKIFANIGLEMREYGAKLKTIH